MKWNLPFQTLWINVLLFFTLSVQAQIPLFQQTDWTIASEGPQLDWSGIPVVNLISYGADPSGSLFSDSAIQNVLNQYDDSVQLYFPAGQYKFENGIHLNSFTRLYGEGSDQTQLIFDSGIASDAISATGTRSTLTLSPKNDIQRKDRHFTVDSTHSSMVGRYFYVIDNDVDKTTSAWAAGSTGQMVRVIGLSGDTLHIESEFRRNFIVNKQAAIYPVYPVQNLEISNVKIAFLDSTASQQFSNIRLSHVVNARVSCIESVYCIFSHVELNSCYRVAIDKSVFRYGHDYGGGGRAYGVALQFGTSDALISHCYFSTLRHSVLLQAGANGNVIFGNFSENPYWTDVFLPSNSAGELVLHGNYPYANLFENNSVQNIVIDDSHGRNGPYNAFFRNRTSGYGIFMNFNPPTDSVHFIGNVVDAVYGPGMYFVQGNGHTEVYNSVNGQVTPSNSQTLLTNTFLSNPPSLGLYPDWPAIGPDLSTSTSIVQRAIDQNIGLCSPFLNLHEKEPEVSIYPNPTNGLIYIPQVNQVQRIRIYNTKGAVVDEFYPTEYIDLSDKEAGLLWVEFIFKNNSRSVHKIIRID